MHEPGERAGFVVGEPDDAMQVKQRSDGFDERLPDGECVLAEHAAIGGDATAADARRVATRASFACTPERVWRQLLYYEEIDQRPSVAARRRSRAGAHGRAQIGGGRRSDVRIRGRRAAKIEAWRRLCTWRLRAGIATTLSLTGLRAVYASPFLAVLPPRFGQVLLARFARGFGRHPNRHNPYARALFLGEPPPADPPLTGVELICRDAAAYLEACGPASFTGVSLSNILDGASPGYRDRLFAALRRAVRPDGNVVLRSFAEPTAPRWDELAARDRALLWASVRIEPAAALC
jgi:hypothetical protein